MSDYIARTIVWLRQNKYSRVILEGSGGGDSGSIDNITVYGAAGSPIDTKLVPKWMQDGLESDATDIADWDWCNDEGGTIKLTVSSDGSYRVSGGWYASKLVQATPTEDHLTDDDLAPWLNEGESAAAPAIAVTIPADKVDEVARVLAAAGTDACRNLAEQIEQSIRNTR